MDVPMDAPMDVKSPVSTTCPRIQALPDSKYPSTVTHPYRKSRTKNPGLQCKWTDSQVRTFELTTEYTPYIPSAATTEFPWALSPCPTTGEETHRVPATFGSTPNLTTHEH
ncbi:uncharacterized protein N7482_003454 [Penicillium canariense]|uniref:Uncharacterized protein n=1 Tax=Penicillium canariense TaxID=189055 RepID=A0A9W9LPB8_9EURO|nr:uncharacterized protein N7482_003454 [Penicillium canariense]KAJ5167860.1 hypothetical protein N7482_003454 [Penicillium canariense]